MNWKCWEGTDMYCACGDEKWLQNFKIRSFTAIKSNKIFSGDQPHQIGAEAQRFGDFLCLHHQGNSYHSVIIVTEKVSITFNFCSELRWLVARK